MQSNFFMAKGSRLEVIREIMCVISSKSTVKIVGYGSDTDCDAWLELGAGCTFHEVGSKDETGDARKKFNEEQVMDLKGID